MLISPRAIVILAGLGLAACDPGRALAAPDVKPGDRKPGDLRFEPFTFKAGGGIELAAELGRLIVPENRARPGATATIELAFVRLKSTAAKPGPPLIVLAGGPGGSGVSETRVYWQVFRPLLERADVIALDQRGTGRSLPLLGCPGVAGFSGDDLASRGNMVRAVNARFQGCADDLRAKSIDVTAYNTRESADDIDDLRRALGAERVDLWGFSFGTQLGLMTLLRHGAHVRRAVFAAVEGLDATRKLPSDLDAHLADVSRIARADPRWAKRVPDLRALIIKLRAQLDRTPVGVELVDRASGAARTVQVGGFALAAVLGLDAGDTKHIARFPALLDGLARGDLTLLTKRVQALQDKITAPAPWAMTFATDCASGATAARDRQIEREAARSALGTAINFPWPDVCPLWGSPDLGDALRVRVKSDVPVLLISGALDGRTPVARTRELRAGLRNSTLLVVDHAGHEDVFSPPAVVDAIAAFLADKPIAVSKASHTPLELSPPLAP